MPGRMRYFDGELWTNHFHNPGQLPDIGGWFSNSFSVFGRYWKGASAIALVVALVGNIVLWFAVRSLLNNVVVVDETIINLTGGVTAGLIAVTIFSFLWQGFGWLALNRYLQRAHFQAEPTVGEAFTHALRRLPKYVGVVLGLAFAAMLLLVLVTAISLAVPFLGALLIIAMLVAGVWVFVKLTFLSAAIVAAPADAPALQTSAGVSTGRFWAVLGRVVLLSIVVGIAGIIVTSLLRVVTGLDPVFDFETLSAAFDFDGDELVVEDLRFRDLFASGGSMIAELLVTGLVQTATTLITTSAFMRLYLDSGAPSDI